MIWPFYLAIQLLIYNLVRIVKLVHSIIRSI
ncbi:hypothetical protein BLA29_015347 [Euroglyphus maynei]|uniref:Uncharacterized protein n=1 Tax=Euroglyphus maynei TaxID=6958 RepID=A0A1Y3BWQ0_EURMA|nr:hypothetical protein BLA29_015347 [Euroglyphus maynei]